MALGVMGLGLRELTPPHCFSITTPVPGISGLNFVLTQALGGGGLASLHMDRQGKAYAQMLLSLPVTVPRQWLATDSPARL